MIKGTEEAKRWLKQAMEDLKWAKYLLKEGAYYLVCFLSQQIAEKSLKAYLYYKGEEIVIGHSIHKLCKRAGSLKKNLMKSLKYGVFLILIIFLPDILMDYQMGFQLRFTLKKLPKMLLY